jgi:hypothetical protein
METAKQDWAEEEKRRNLGLVRKLVGQRQFDQARTILGELEKENPQDRAVLKLRDLVEQGEREINREIRLTKRVAELRRLVREEKFADVTAQGEALLQEYQHDYELEELVAYARTESARRQAEEREAGLAKQIQDALTAKRYNDAAAKAQKAVREFPGHPQFQKLWEETEQKRKEQAIRDEFQRRIQDIQRRITRQELTEAIDIAQQTLATMGPSEQVSQLLQAAKVEQREKIQRDQQQRLDEIATLLDGGKLDGATQMLNDAFATQIFQPSHPRAKDLLAQIASRSGTAYQPKAPSTEIATQTAKPYVPESSPEPSLFSATKVLTPTPTPAAADANPAGLLESPQAPGRSPARQNSPAPVRSDSSVPAAVDRPPGARQIRRGKSVPSRLKWDVGRFLTALKDRAVPVGLSLRELSVRGTGAIAAWRLSPRDLAAKRRVILAVGGAVVLVGSVSIGLRMWRDYRTSHFPSAMEEDLRRQAEQAWEQHEPDRAEEKWRQLAALHGPLEGTASQQVASIEKLRANEQQSFDEGNRLLQANPQDAQGRQSLQKVADMHMWHALEAQTALNNVDQLAQNAVNLSEQEKQLFTQGEEFVNSKNYDLARRRFLDLLNLPLPNSSLRPQAQEFLGKIRALNDDKKNYDIAMQDIQNEDWDAARDGLTAIAAHKGALKDEVQRELDKTSSVQNTINEATQLIHSQSYRLAKGKLEGLQTWPKTFNRLRLELNSAEQQEFTSLKANAQSLLLKQDLAGLRRLQGQLDGLLGRAQDASTRQPMEQFSESLSSQIVRVTMEQSPDKPAFDKAEADFKKAMQNGDIDLLQTEISHEFSEIADGNGSYRESARQYVTKVIPDTIQELTKNLAAVGEVAVPAISCGAAQGDRPTIQSNEKAVACAQLDADSPLKWLGKPTVALPSSAKGSGKLPYTLHLFMVADANGKVRVEKDGAVDEDFYKKAKDASKAWRTTRPLLNGKPVSATFPIAITFQP